MYWNLIILFLSIGLLLFLLWKEFKRRNKLSRTARIIATLLAVTSLALIALPVTVNRKVQQAQAEEAVVLTQGYNKDTVQKFLKQNPGVKVFTLDKNIKYANASYLPDPGTLSEKYSDLPIVHVFGYGLREYEVKQFDRVNLVFHKAAIANKIISADWQPRIISGDKLKVQGKFNNSSSGPVKIFLSAFNTNLDSVTLLPRQTSEFQLSTVPKHIDKAIYALTVISAKDTIETNPIPVEVVTAKRLNILLLAASPDFENKFLKNWLTENEFGFAVRTYISKNKYDRQYVNISSISLGRMTSALLEKFDVVIADLAELNDLPSSDMMNLRSAVEARGLGLIVKATMATRSPGFNLNSFPLVETRDSIQHTVKLTAGSLSIPSPLKIQQPVYIMNRSGTEPLLTDQHTRTLVSSKLSGLGKIVITTIPNSYAWWLSGAKEDYAVYWTLLLNKAAKKVDRNQAWQQGYGFPKKDVEINLSLQSASDSVPRLQIGSELIYPYQNPNLPYEWSAKYWPLRSGWHAMVTNNEPAFWLYVYGDNEWQGIAAGEKILATGKYASAIGTTPRSIDSERISVEVPKVYFLILFIIAVAFLWFEKKYRNG